MDPWKLLETTDARAWRNFELLQAAQGHMMNAMFALEAGETKASAIDILKRGLAIIEAAHAETMAKLAAQGIPTQRAETACPAPFMGSPVAESDAP